MRGFAKSVLSRSWGAQGIACCFLFFLFFGAFKKNEPVDQGYGVHHYVYENGRYVPQTYKYDPAPHYRAFSYDFPPYYTVNSLSYYEGLDRGRREVFQYHRSYFR